MWNGHMGLEGGNVAGVEMGLGVGGLGVGPSWAVFWERSLSD